MKIILETPRLILRHQVPADLDDAQAKIELLQAQVEALQESIAQMRPLVTS